MNKNQNILWLVLGIGAMVLTIVPNLILGLDSIFTYHDQLDGELIAYILQARNLGESSLAEFMGGSPKTALTLPAPVFVLLFLGDNYFGALLAMQLIGRIAGFAGMYLLARDRTGYPFIGAVAGLLYGLLPFLPVYGLSQYGLPLLIWCVLQIREKRYQVFSYCYVALYALGSSLVLVGFGVLGMGLLWLLWELICGKTRRCPEKGSPEKGSPEKGSPEKGNCPEKRSVWGLAAAWGLLLLLYIGENLPLFAQMAGTAGEEASHKAEYVLRATPFLSTFWDKLLNGGQHSEGFQRILVPVCLAAVAVSLLVTARGRGRNGKTGPGLKTMVLCLGCNVFFALVAALWSTEPIVKLRGSMGALGAFQLERLLWMAPCLWYLFGACGAGILAECFKSAEKRMGKAVAFVCGGALALAVAVTGAQILLNGDVKSNVQKLRNPDYGVLSFRNYYAIGVLEQVEEFLEERTGQQISEYRVVSLGIDPAAALYHGFYCLDGYSNNYSLAYKHAFRRVIAPELQKSEYLQEYFDEWGNRCYLFSAECPGYYTIEKGGFYFQDYQLNTEALKEMGCDYLFSAAYIMDGETQGLKLLNEVPFETSDSYYRIYVYEICQ